VATQVGKLRKTNQDQANALAALASTLAGATNGEKPEPPRNKSDRTKLYPHLLAG
jgi:hypothetical protein